MEKAVATMTILFAVAAIVHAQIMVATEDYEAYGEGSPLSVNGYWGDASNVAAYVTDP